MARTSPTQHQATLGDLFCVVDECAATTEETLAVVDHLLRTGRVRLHRRPPESPTAPVAMVNFYGTLGRGPSGRASRSRGRPRA
jgi:hypothetical protein